MGSRNDSLRSNRYRRDRSSLISFKVAPTDARLSNVASAAAALSAGRDPCSIFKSAANRDEVMAHEHIEPAQASNDRSTITLSNSTASGSNVNPENSANRSSITRYRHARAKRTASAVESIEPRGSDGESIIAIADSGKSAAESGPMKLALPGPRTIRTSSFIERCFAIWVASVDGGKPTTGPVVQATKEFSPSAALLSK